MTVSDIRDATAALGFEPNLEEGVDVFFPALNRAIRQVNRLRAKTAKTTILHFPEQPLEHFRIQVKKAGTDLVLQANSDAVSFTAEIAGTGTATVKKANGTVLQSVSYNGDSTVFAKIHLTGEGATSVTFSGGSGFVRNASFFASDTEQIYSDVISYDMNDLVNDFDGFCTLNLTTDGKSCVEIPANSTGCYDVWYKVKPQTFTINSEEEDVKIDDDLAQLLPLLIAAYVWLDDEPDKSAYYMRLYSEQALMIDRKPRCPTIITSCNNWG